MKFSLYLERYTLSPVNANLCTELYVKKNSRENVYKTMIYSIVLPIKHVAFPEI